jgi:hypothetical protein
MSDCNVSSARNYVWFFAGNDPPATYSAVARKDELYEYRADGKYGKSSTWIAVAIVCGESGLAVVISFSESPKSAIAYVEEIMSTLTWRRRRRNRLSTRHVTLHRADVRQQASLASGSRSRQTLGNANDECPS